MIAGLLDWDGPAVVVSVKRDLIDATRSARAARSARRECSTPPACPGLPPAGSARWTPLRAAGTPRGAQKAAVALAASIPRSGVDGGADYWVKQAEILLTGLLGAAALDRDRTMVDVAEWVFTKDIPVKERAERDRRHPRTSQGQRHARRAGGGGGGDAAARRRLEPRRAGPVVGVRDRADRRAGVARPGRRRLRDARRRPDQRFVDLDWLTDPERSNTLYLVAPLDDQKRLAPVLGGLLGDLKDQAYQRDVAGVGLGRPLLMVIDEAGNMPLAWLPEVAATCAGIGILLVTIWQSKAQLDAAYGRLVRQRAHQPPHQDRVLRLLRPGHPRLRRPAARRRGRAAPIAVLRHRRRHRRRSVSESTHREALTPFHLLRQVRPGEAVLIHGTLPPAHLQARR